MLGAVGYLSGQSFNIGVRAGLNGNTFLGPVEEGESYSFSTGFHFGLSYQYNFVDNFGIRGELEYSQTGGRKTYSGPSYYIIRNGDNAIFEPGFLFGPGDTNNQGIPLDDDSPPGFLLEVSNAYLNIPITAHLKLGDKIEVLGGIYAGFNINPTANGSLRFDSENNPDDIFFEQALNYRYYQDEALQATGTGATVVFVNDEGISIPRVAGAYFQQATVENSTYRVIDFGVVGGLNYYLNKGFYVGGRVNYGLLDVTRSNMDFSFREFDPIGKTQVTREDKDTNLVIEVSLGFKF
jgi:hypothetical protein